jgi:hypothetical protein
VGALRLRACRGHLVVSGWGLVDWIQLSTMDEDPGTRDPAGDGARFNLQAQDVMVPCDGAAMRQGAGRRAGLQGRLGGGWCVRGIERTEVKQGGVRGRHVDVRSELCTGA